MLHHVSFRASRPPASWDGDGAAVRTAHDAELLDLAEPAQDARVVLIGPESVELLCELIRRGRLDAATVQFAACPEAGAADIALVVPSIASFECANAALAQVRRALAPLGRLALRLAADPTGSLVRAVHRALLLHGFSAIRLRRSAGRTLLSARLSMTGRPTTADFGARWRHHGMRGAGRPAA